MTIVNAPPPPGRDWKRLVATVAPALATALGGPLAGVATQALSAALLGNSDGSTEEVATAVLTGGADGLLKIREADHAFAARMAELEIDLERVHQTDRASARTLATVNMRPQIVLSLVFICGYFGALAATSGMLFSDREPNAAILSLASALVGVFTRELSGIMQFWFGSSSGSKEKTAQLSDGGVR